MKTLLLIQDSYLRWRDMKIERGAWKRREVGAGVGGGRQL